MTRYEGRTIKTRRMHPECICCDHKVDEVTISIEFTVAAPKGQLPSSVVLAHGLEGGLPKEWFDPDSGDTWWVSRIR